MILTWLRNRRRRQLLATPFPAEWLQYLRSNVSTYTTLSEAEQAKLRDMLRVFIAEKTWEGCGGLRMTDEIKVTIAAQACLLVLGYDDFYFEKLRTILVYPHGYVAPQETVNQAGIVDASGSARLGEAHYRGPIVLSWSDALAGGKTHRDGKNLVFHEFAHELDMLDGAADGTPPMPDGKLARWRDVMTTEYHRLLRDSEHQRATLLDEYGTTNEAEFFAVATECFFEKPVQMQRRHLQLYEVLRDFYRQDPAARHERPLTAPEKR
jgi:Mlc titration factor MtfA (ptsG expression regulator)